MRMFAILFAFVSAIAFADSSDFVLISDAKKASCSIEGLYHTYATVLENGQVKSKVKLTWMGDEEGPEVAREASNWLQDCNMVLQSNSGSVVVSKKNGYVYDKRVMDAAIAMGDSFYRNPVSLMSGISIRSEAGSTLFLLRASHTSIQNGNSTCTLQAIAQPPPTKNIQDFFNRALDRDEEDGPTKLTNAETDWFYDLVRGKESLFVNAPAHSNVLLVPNDEDVKVVGYVYHYIPETSGGYTSGEYSNMLILASNSSRLLAMICPNERGISAEVFLSQLGRMGAKINYTPRTVPLN